MMRYDSLCRQQSAGRPYLRPDRASFDGYQYSLFAPPAGAAIDQPVVQGPNGRPAPYTVRAVAPALRPLMTRYSNRCPDCAGPLVNGEACVACPVCGFRRRGW